jgi:hypothetical protein
MRTVVYGSCVSRDSFALLPAASWELLGYTARQSLISAAAGPANIPKPPIESSFQRRMVWGDIEGDLASRLDAVAATCELVLWDLVDERLGVYESSDGRVVTRSVDLMSAGGMTEEGWSLLELGTRRHLLLWERALDWFLETLEARDLRRRLVLLQVPWARSTNVGKPTPTSFGMSADDAEDRMRRYHELAEAAGVRCASVDVADVQADAAHRWGVAPFHYTANTYSSILDAIRTAAATTKG